MLKRIINFEINEIYPQLIMDYIADEKYKNSTLRKLFHKKLIKFYTTKALDVEESKLYPSQSWASFNSGEPYEMHKCYWYSDFINSKKMIWSKLVNYKKSVGIIGSIHSSKYPEDLFHNNNYLFYLPDCFSNQKKAKPNIYENFQELNNQLVEGSARVTNYWNLFIVFGKNLIKILINPSSFGIGLFSVKSILKILFFSIKTRNKEFLRMGQFPLIAQIFYNLFNLKNPDYSSLFSNHIAGNLHRYMYAHNIDAFSNKKKYTEKWIKRNRYAINFSIDLFDDFLGFILNKKEFIDSTIVITSSIGQKPTDNFSKKNLPKFDGKIIDFDKFIKQLCIYQKEFHQISVEYKYERNMAPQYGIKVIDLKNYVITDIVNSIKKFLLNLNLKNDVELEGSSIVISINPYEDSKLQKKCNIKQANILYSKYGFKFFRIDDHHSGSHCKEGLLALYNPSSSLQNNLENMLEKDGSLDYLNFQKLVIDYLKN